MKIYDVEGNSIDWKPNGREVTLDNRPRSNLHKKAREVIKDRFYTLQVLEEVIIPVRPKINLYLDFYLPLRKIAVEVNGEQHYSFNSMFHKTRQDFIRQKKRDAMKTEWCKINGIELIVFKFNEIDNWSNLL